MIDVDRGIVYYIILKKEVDYFDVVPDVEKMSRHRILLKQTRIDGESIAIIDERLEDALRSHPQSSDAPRGSAYVAQVLQINSQENTLQRLLDSAYYTDRQQTWDDMETWSRADRAIPTEQLQDVCLTSREKSAIENALQHPLLSELVLYHGWFDCIQMQ